MRSASRLSYFLWNSMPDEMLFDLAGTGKLHEPAVLDEEVGRMLRSPKARRSSRASLPNGWVRVNSAANSFRMRNSSPNTPRISNCRAISAFSQSFSSTP